jgi:hypothetical protein
MTNIYYYALLLYVRAQIKIDLVCSLFSVRITMLRACRNVAQIESSSVPVQGPY